MRTFDASGGLFTLALRDDSSQAPSERGSVWRLVVAVAASLVTGSGRVRRRACTTARGQGAR